MSFEKSNVMETPEAEERLLEEGEKGIKGQDGGSLKNKLGQAVAIGAVGIAALSGEGCKPDNNADSNQDFAKEALKVLNNLNQENNKQQEKILFNYFYNLEKTGNGGDPHSIFYSDKGVEESKARAWDIVKKKGLFKNGVDGKANLQFKRVGIVPVEIQVNGEFVPVGQDDYTREELSVVRNSNFAVESIDGKNTTDDKEKTDNSRVPSSSKPFVSHPDDF